MNTDANLYASILAANEQVMYQRPENRAIYVHVARGSLQVNGVTLQAGDALQIREETELRFSTADSAEFLVFDLP